MKRNDRLILTFTYHLSVMNFQNVLNEAGIFLTPKKEHRKVLWVKPPTIGWRKPKSLENHLVSAKTKCESSSDNKSAPCYGLDAKFALLLRKLTPFKTRIKVKRLTLKKGFWTVVAIKVFTWFSENHVLSSIWIVLLHRSVPVLIIIKKKGLKNCQKFIPIIVVSI